MPDEAAALQERVQRSIQKLSLSAKALNKSSDELSVSIAEINAVLQKLNIGVSRWLSIHEEKKNAETITRYVGYDRVSGHWGIAIQSTTRKTASNDVVDNTRWLFNDAPRWLRTLCLDRIPDLLDALAGEADKHRAMIDGKLKTAKDLATFVKANLK